MHKRKNVLVFPCGSEIGIEIFNSLKWSTHIEIFGASSLHSNHGRFLYKNYIENIPFIGDKLFIEKLNEVINKNKIDFLYPANDDVILYLSENREKIACKLILPNKETCRLTRSKKQTYKYFRDIIRVPQTIIKLKMKKSEFPLFVKPDIGQGAKGATIVNNKEELDFLIEKNPNLVIMEYLPGKEYTIDCFTDKNGSLLFSQGRERIRTMNGISVNAKPIENSEFHKIAKIINNHINMRGAWFFQLKRNKNNKLTLLEIAPRVAGCMSLCRNMGVNLPMLSVFDFSGVEVCVNNKNHFTIEEDRALFNRFQTNLKYSIVYIDLDDTMILWDKINPSVIHFIYQSINKKCKIILITKHSENIEKTLKKYKIIELFDKIIHIKKSENKSKFITEKNSIYIDDSFSERLDISENCGVPTFDTHSIECLIDWKN